MSTTEANIAITRHEGILSSVSVIMPTWNKHEIDEVLSVSIPMLGIKTFASNDEDANQAIEEAIKCFCISAEKFGKGLEAELEELDWVYVQKEQNQSLMDYNVPDKNVVMEQMMQTGEQYVTSNLEIEEYQYA